MADFFSFTGGIPLANGRLFLSILPRWYQNGSNILAKIDTKGGYNSYEISKPYICESWSVVLDESEESSTRKIYAFAGNDKDDVDSFVVLSHKDASLEGVVSLKADDKTKIIPFGKLEKELKFLKTKAIGLDMNYTIDFILEGETEFTESGYVPKIYLNFYDLKKCLPSALETQIITSASVTEDKSYNCTIEAEIVTVTPDGDYTVNVPQVTQTEYENFETYAGDLNISLNNEHYFNVDETDADYTWHEEVSGSPAHGGVIIPGTLSIYIDDGNGGYDRYDDNLRGKIEDGTINYLTGQLAGISGEVVKSSYSVYDGTSVPAISSMSLRGSNDSCTNYKCCAGIRKGSFYIAVYGVASSEERVDIYQDDAKGNLINYCGAKKGTINYLTGDVILHSDFMFYICVAADYKTVVGASKEIYKKTETDRFYASDFFSPGSGTFVCYHADGSSETITDVGDGTLSDGGEIRYYNGRLTFNDSYSVVIANWRTPGPITFSETYELKIGTQTTKKIEITMGKGNIAYEWSFKDFSVTEHNEIKDIKEFDGKGFASIYANSASMDSDVSKPLKIDRKIISSSGVAYSDTVSAGGDLKDVYKPVDFFNAATATKLNTFKTKIKKTTPLGDLEYIISSLKYIETIDKSEFKDETEMILLFPFGDGVNCIAYSEEDEKLYILKAFGEHTKQKETQLIKKYSYPINSEIWHWTLIPKNM